MVVLNRGFRLSAESGPCGDVRGRLAAWNQRQRIPWGDSRLLHRSYGGRVHISDLMKRFSVLEEDVQKHGGRNEGEEERNIRRGKIYTPPFVLGFNISAVISVLMAIFWLPKPPKQVSRTPKMTGGH
ncbi:hypothetical protein SLA2020_316380 [Shorea laevis]